MKKCYFILGLILATSTANAAANNYANNMQSNVKSFCVTMFEEQGTTINKEVKDFCGKVAKCVVDGAPNNYALQNSSYMENAMLSCLYKHAQDL